jgi:hypothetical protein
MNKLKYIFQAFFLLLPTLANADHGTEGAIEFLANIVFLILVVVILFINACISENKVITSGMKFRLVLSLAVLLFLFYAEASIFYALIICLSIINLFKTT